MFGSKVIGGLCGLLSVAVAYDVGSHSVSSVFDYLAVMHGRCGNPQIMVEFYIEVFLPLELTVPLACWAIARRLSHGVLAARGAFFAAAAIWLASILLIKYGLP